MKQMCGFLALALLLRGADAPKRPDLVILISVDMLSGEIMDRYGGGLPGGLGKLEREGVFFENGFQEHAFTETGPGHSVLLSGRHPASTGIPANQWRDRTTGKMIYCVEDSKVTDFGDPTGKAGSSGVRFKGTTLGTWLKHQIPGSRVFSIAGKDRAAILMAGPNADGVYWFQDGFGFTSSTAYTKKLPGWLTEFDQNLLADLRNKSITWTPMGPDDGLTYPGRWMAGNTPVISRLPRLIQTAGLGMQAKGGYLFKETPDGSFWRRWWASPFFDDVTLDAAEALIRNEHLGEGHTDLLAVGLSATNALEHAYGNSGPEMLDQIRRLDRRLGVFFDRVQAGGRSIEVVLSADHGGLDFAERLQDQGIPAKRIDVAAWIKELQSRVRKEFHSDQDVLLIGDEHDPDEIYLNPALAPQLGDFKEAIARVVKIVRSMPDIAVAAAYDEIAALPQKRFADPREENLLYRLKFSAAPERAGEILLAFNPLVERGGPPGYDPAQHGSAYDYDRRVPIIFWGPWKGEERLAPASTVDIAPTLARELAIRPEERVDGIALDLSPKDD
ncbi:MAG TPA: alkaline phosphatase family protein [Bryobacteraceae bacterium]|nr:alkaline phosphatase family protein [Bryobacteraceae bacterium]